MSDFQRGLLGAFAFVAGASVGSFVNVIAYRLPREVSIVTPRSFCPACERTIPWFANIPILAYLGLRGRCLMCGAAIPLRYFLAEVSLAVAALYLFLSFPFADAASRFVLCAALFAISAIDYDFGIIPHSITIPGIVYGVAAAALAMPEVGWLSSLIGIVVGAGVLLVIGALYRLVRHREGIGMGDVWLLAMVGAFIGWQGALFTLFAGSMLGSIGGLLAAFSSRRAPQGGRVDTSGEGGRDSSILMTKVPFGPFLAIAAAIYALFQPQLTAWYLGS